MQGVSREYSRRREESRVGRTRAAGCPLVFNKRSRPRRASFSSSPHIRGASRLPHTALSAEGRVRVTRRTEYIAEAGARSRDELTEVESAEEEVSLPCLESRSFFSATGDIRQLKPTWYSAFRAGQEPALRRPKSRRG